MLLEKWAMNNHLEIAVKEMVLLSKAVYYVTTNENKVKELQEIISDTFNVDDIKIVMFNENINEIPNNDITEIVKDKLVKAFKILHRPVIVEQSGLRIKDFGNLPNGLTSEFWDQLSDGKVKDQKILQCEEKMLQYFKGKAVTAVSCIGYCDGIKLFWGTGEVDGEIVERDTTIDIQTVFGWDRIFCPDEFDGKTYATMNSKEKNEVSMRKRALEDLINQGLFKSINENCDEIKKNVDKIEE